MIMRTHKLWHSMLIICFLIHVTCSVRRLHRNSGRNEKFWQSSTFTGKQQSPRKSSPALQASASSPYIRRLSDSDKAGVQSIESDVGFAGEDKTNKLLSALTLTLPVTELTSLQDKGLTTQDNSLSDLKKLTENIESFGVTVSLHNPDNFGGIQHAIDINPQQISYGNKNIHETAINQNAHQTKTDDLGDSSGYKGYDSFSRGYHKDSDVNEPSAHYNKELQNPETGQHVDEFRTSGELQGHNLHSDRDEQVSDINQSSVSYKNEQLQNSLIRPKSYRTTPERYFPTAEYQQSPNLNPPLGSRNNKIQNAAVHKGLHENGTTEESDARDFQEHHSPSKGQGQASEVNEPSISYKNQRSQITANHQNAFKSNGNFEKHSFPREYQQTSEANKPSITYNNEYLQDTSINQRSYQTRLKDSNTPEERRSFSDGYQQSSDFKMLPVSRNNERIQSTAMTQNGYQSKNTGRIDSKNSEEQQSFSQRYQESSDVNTKLPNSAFQPKAEDENYQLETNDANDYQEYHELSEGYHKNPNTNQPSLPYSNVQIQNANVVSRSYQANIDDSITPEGNHYFSEGYHHFSDLNQPSASQDKNQFQIEAMDQIIPADKSNPSYSKRYNSFSEGYQYTSDMNRPPVSHNPVDLPNTEANQRKYQTRTNDESNSAEYDPFYERHLQDLNQNIPSNSLNNDHSRNRAEISSTFQTSIGDPNIPERNQRASAINIPQVYHNNEQLENSSADRNIHQSGSYDNERYDMRNENLNQPSFPYNNQQLQNTDVVHRSYQANIDDSITPEGNHYFSEGYHHFTDSNQPPVSHEKEQFQNEALVQNEDQIRTIDKNDPSYSERYNPLSGRHQYTSDINRPSVSHDPMDLPRTETDQNVYQFRTTDASNSEEYDRLSKSHQQDLNANKPSNSLNNEPSRNRGINRNTFQVSINNPNVPEKNQRTSDINIRQVSHNNEPLENTSVGRSIQQFSRIGNHPFDVNSGNLFGGNVKISRIGDVEADKGNSEWPTGIDSTSSHGNNKGERVGRMASIPGTPGLDYPDYVTIPKTRFNCHQYDHPGYFADMEAQCQVYHICQHDGRHDAFLCPVGTMFNQKVFTCDWWFNVDCASSGDYYYQNAYLYSQSNAESHFKGYNTQQSNLQVQGTHAATGRSFGNEFSSRSLRKEGDRNEQSRNYYNGFVDTNEENNGFINKHGQQNDEYRGWKIYALDIDPKAFGVPEKHGDWAEENYQTSVKETNKKSTKNPSTEDENTYRSLENFDASKQKDTRRSSEEFSRETTNNPRKFGRANLLRSEEDAKEDEGRYNTFIKIIENRADDDIEIEKENVFGDIEIFDKDLQRDVSVALSESAIGSKVNAKNNEESYDFDIKEDSLEERSGIETENIQMNDENFVNLEESDIERKEKIPEPRERVEKSNDVFDRSVQAEQNSEETKVLGEESNYKNPEIENLGLLFGTKLHDNLKQERNVFDYNEDVRRNKEGYISPLGAAKRIKIVNESINGESAFTDDALFGIAAEQPSGKVQDKEINLGGSFPKSDQSGRKIEELNSSVKIDTDSAQYNTTEGEKKLNVEIPDASVITAREAISKENTFGSDDISTEFDEGVIKNEEKRERISDEVRKNRAIVSGMMANEGISRGDVMHDMLSELKVEDQSHETEFRSEVIPHAIEKNSKNSESSLDSFEEKNESAVMNKKSIHQDDNSDMLKNSPTAITEKIPITIGNLKIHGRNPERDGAESRILTSVVQSYRKQPAKENTFGRKFKSPIRSRLTGNPSRLLRSRFSISRNVQRTE